MISTRKSTRITCNKDPLSNFISYHLIPFSTSRKSWRQKKTNRRKKVLFLLGALIPALISGEKKQKVAGSVSGAAKYGVKKALETATRKKLKKAYDATLCRNEPTFKSSKCYRRINKKSAKERCKQTPEKIIRSFGDFMSANYAITWSPKTSAAKMSELCVIFKLRYIMGPHNANWLDRTQTAT